MVKAVREITGRPGRSFGYIVVPASGKTTMRITGDILEAKSKTAYGLEQRESYTRIQRIETVEMIEGRIWWLLSIGVPLLAAYFVGVVPIIAFFLLKQKRLVVHDKSGNNFLFYKDSAKAKDFCQTLMLVSRQLNSKSTPVSNQRNKQRSQNPNNGRPPVDKRFSA